MALIQQETIERGIVLLTINRPEQRNAINLQVVQELSAKLDALAHEPPAVVLLTGAGGRAFVAGADIAELKERGANEALQQINAKLFRLVEAFPSPTIAVIDGFAFGGGCELALACDLRIASTESQFAQPETSLGIIPAAGATYRLARHIGLGRARDMIFTGRRVSAAEALNIGLVNRVSPRERLREAALGYAREIAENGPLAVRLAKVAINSAFAADATLAQLESAAQAVLFESPDKHARMSAFLKKSKAPKKKKKKKKAER